MLRKAVKSALIICNVTIALLLVIGCYGSYIGEGKYWTLGLLTLASVYFFILLFGFFVFWLFVKPIYTLIGLVTFFICWSPIHNMIQFRLSSDFNYKKNPSDIRVMSWNVEHFCINENKTHPEKKYQMIQLINQLEPDVACFQEMVASDSFFTAIDFVPDFEKNMNMHHSYYAFNKKLDFDKQHHFGIIIFCRYPIFNKHTYAYDDKRYNSTFQSADFVKNGDTFRIFNIHLQSLRLTKENRTYLEDPAYSDESDWKESKSILTKFRTGFYKRHVQIDRIKETIDKSPYPVILCGDFNDVPNSYAYNKINSDFTNAFFEKGSGIGNTFDGISPTLRIDNIFSDKRLEVVQYLRIRKKLSDHFPVVADLSYNKN